MDGDAPARGFVPVQLGRLTYATVILSPSEARLDRLRIAYYTSTVYKSMISSSFLFLTSQEIIPQEKENKSGNYQI
jgi:hypothetical protein